MTSAQQPGRLVPREWPQQQARDYEQALRERGKTFEVHYYDGVGHGLLYTPSTENDIRTRTIEFFAKHLQP